MKVPSPTQGRVRPVLQAAAYTQPASNVGAGAQMIAKGLNSLGAVFEERTQKTDRFNTLRSFSQFETDVAARLTDLKRNYSPDGKGFTQAADQAYTEMEESWLPNVPEDLKEEFRFRTQQSRQGIMGDALKFQYQAGDAWFRQGISDELSKSKVVLDQTPEALAAEQQRIFEVIESSDLSAVEKAELQRQATIGLASVTYKAEVRKDAGSRGSLGIGEPSSVVDRIVGVESGGNPNAKNPNSSAEGLGQFIDSTWLGMLAKYRPDIQGSREELLALKRDGALSREMTQRYAEENSEKLARAGVTPTNGNIYLGHFLGPAGAIAVGRASPDTPVSEILSADQIAANKSILAGKTAGEVRAWASKKMGNATLETDPRFAAIPYEDRIALFNDAERQVTEEQRRAAAEAKAAREKAQSDLYLNLYDGKMGQADIDAARQNGVLDDYDSVKKAQQIIKDRDAEQALALGGLSKLASGAPFDPTDASDKKSLNAMVKQEGGLEKISSGDQDYFSSAIVPLVRQVGDIPTDVAGTLMGMVRGANNSQMMYALDALAQLRDTSPIAFNQRVSDDVSQQVELWDALKGQGQDQAELLNRVRGATTQAERQQQAVLRKEAQDILTRSEDGVAMGQKFLDNAIAEFDTSWFGANPAIGVPLARQSLSREFNAFFIEAYSKTGNAEIASDLASKQLQRQWGQTSVGGGGDLMKYPPEKVGYRQVNGSYDWINESIRTDLGLAEDVDFDLFSDEQTRQEFQAFQRNPNAEPPSYRVFTKDENGVYRERYDERGRPMRLNFKPTERALEMEERSFDWQARRFELEETIFNYQAMQSAAAGEISDEDTAAYNEATEELRKLDEESQNAQSSGAAIGRMGAGLPPIPEDQELTQEQQEFLFGELAKGKTLREALGIKLRRN